MEGLQYRMQLSALDCLGCGNCAGHLSCQRKRRSLWNLTLMLLKKQKTGKYGIKTSRKDKKRVDTHTVKGSQFAKPYIEFSGACSGCGETPYIKLVTQLFGDRMLIANATGCSSIWGASAPSMPYCKDENGRGPAWANSLFEDNAEYGYGMLLAAKQMREKIEHNMKALMELDIDEKLKEAIEEWLEYKDDGRESRAKSDKVI